MDTLNLSYTASYIGIDAMFVCVGLHEIFHTVLVRLCPKSAEKFPYLSPAVHNYCHLREI
jgi:hypothetical protein